MRAASRWAAMLAMVVGAFSAGAGAASTNLLANASFEGGRARPDHWTLFSPLAGTWEFKGKDGERCVSLTGSGGDVGWWAAEQAAVEPGGLYHVSYWVRRHAQARGGSVIAGLNRVNRDSRPGTEWEKREFFFRAPETVEGAFFRVGEWHVSGKIYVDDVCLNPAVAVQRRPPGFNLPLGAGELIVGVRYTATHEMGGAGSTDCRFLERSTALFNSNRWVFDGPAEVVYRHAVSVLRQINAEVEVEINRHQRGTLVVEMSRDGKAWNKLGEVKEAKRVAFPVPEEAPPAREVWIRLACEGEADLQVSGYRYRCELPEAELVERAVGGTWYLEILRSSPELEVEVLDVGDLDRGRPEAVLTVRSKSRRMVQVGLGVEADGSGLSMWGEKISVPAASPQRVTISGRARSAGGHVLRLSCTDVERDEVLWEAAGRFRVSMLHDGSGGELLGESRDGAVWWCEPERKVGRTRPVPEARGQALRVSAAANEYEPVQLVVTPRRELKGCRLSASDLTADSGASIPSSEVDIRGVEYVLVEHPTDEVGAVGEWPDPLPPLGEAMEMAAGRNQPFWVTVRVPPGTPGGDYRGQIRIDAEGFSQRVPLEVHVWGFELPGETHVRSGFGLSRGLIKRYHNLETEEELDEVFDLYLRDFAAHRVAPYSFGRGIGVRWREDKWGELMPELDFSGFDEDARYGLDELGFNSFVLRLQGLGGGSFHSRRAGEIAGYKQGTPRHEDAFGRYARAVERHLSERGWLRKAYIYWFDEPNEQDYQFVREGMELIRRAAPGLTRMLTEHPTHELYGAVDLWCLPVETLEPMVARERQRAGEEIWWYLCCAPRAPYFTLFLDHFGTEMRVWLWATWKYGLSGILVWQTCYWTSGNAYPRPELQNPWRDPMSWKSGYGLGVGGREPWGNGDGRLLYPPNRDPGKDSTKYLEGPIPSIRWELLRDGIEDYEYLWLLREELARAKGAGADEAVCEVAEKLLAVPLEVCADLTHFATTPEPIHAHRAKVAEAIERLRGLDPRG